jgi:hypothetical protein
MVDSVERRGVQAGAFPDQFDDAIDLGVVQRSDVGFGGSTSDGAIWTSFNWPPDATISFSRWQ